MENSKGFLDANRSRAISTILAITFFSGAFFYISTSDVFSISFAAYDPFKIKIASIEVRGQLGLEEKEELFLLSKENELILVIPKYEKFGYEGLTFRHREKLYGATTIKNTIELKSNNPDVSLCYWINPYEENQKYECKIEITTNVAKINIKPQNLEELARAAGILDREVKETILSFDLDGKVDSEQFSVKGSVLYDNTEESRSAYSRRIESATKAWERNQVSGGLILPIIAIAIVALSIILWLIFRFKKRSK